MKHKRQTSPVLAYLMSTSALRDFLVLLAALLLTLLLGLLFASA